MGRRRGADTPLVDGVYDPSFRAAKLERYARLGRERAARVVLEVLQANSSYTWLNARTRRQLGLTILDELARAGCIAFVAAGARESGLERMPTYRSRDVEHLARLGHVVAAREIGHLVQRIEVSFVRNTSGPQHPYEIIAVQLLDALCTAEAIALVQAGVDEENERDQAERNQRK